MLAVSDVTDNCDWNPTVIQSIAEGNLVALGNTTVTVTATDSSNNTVYSKSANYSYLNRLLVLL